MPSSRERPGRWAAIGPAALVELIAPLRDEHFRDGEARLIARDDDRALQDSVTALRRNERVTLLVIEDPAEPSRRASYGTPRLQTDEQGDVVLGWLRLEAEDLRAYANRAVALLRRQPQPTLPIALLGPREERYVALLEELAVAAQSTAGLTAFQWNAERLARHRLMTALRQGAAAAIYAGHGSARGWFAYGGVSADALTAGARPTVDESIGVLFSLACRTAHPGGVAQTQSTPHAHGLADTVVRHGIAGAVLAAVGDPLHEHNRVLAAALVRALRSGVRTCADIVRGLHADGASLDGYAIVGDPAIPVAAAPGVLERCAAIFAPAPEAVLNNYDQ